MSDDFYTYELAYPESMGGAVFYVGKGAGNRINQHEYEARQGGRSRKCEIIRSIWDAGGQVTKRKVYEGLSSRMAEEQERALIHQYGRENLANETDGGSIGKRRQGDYCRIFIEVRKDLLAKIDARPKSRREFIEESLEQFFGRQR